MKFNLLLVIIFSVFLAGCGAKPYENESFPEGDWHPVNPSNFGKAQAQNIFKK